DGSDVAALDHAVPVVTEVALALAHHLAHLRVTRHNGHHAVDLRPADRRGDVRGRDEHAAVVLERDGILAGEHAEAFAVREVEPVLKREPCERAIHGSRVEVPEPEPLGELPRDSALARARGPVDCHDHRLVTDSSSSKKPGKLIATASAPSMSTPSRDTSPVIAPSIARR